MLTVVSVLSTLTVKWQKIGNYAVPGPVEGYRALKPAQLVLARVRPLNVRGRPFACLREEDKGARVVKRPL